MSNGQHDTSPAPGLGNILIVEDEMVIAEGLAWQLKESGYSVVGIADMADKALRLFKDHLIDLVLLDIDIRGEIDGIELAGILSRIRKVPIIFLTASSDRSTVSQASQVHPAAYLIKPYRPKELEIAINIAVMNARQQKHLGNEKQDIAPEKVLLKRNNGSVMVNKSDILYLKAEHQYTSVYTRLGRFMVGRGLTATMKLLDSPSFCQTHRSYVINLSQLEGLGYGNNSAIIRGEDIPIGPKFKERVMSKLHLI